MLIGITRVILDTVGLGWNVQLSGQFSSARLLPTRLSKAMKLERWNMHHRDNPDKSSASDGQDAHLPKIEIT